MTHNNWYNLAGTRQGCHLDGFDGPKLGHAQFPLNLDEFVTVTSDDGTIAIRVGTRLAISKFEQSPRPTFYYS